jgi:hypothetical protein
MLSASIRLTFRKPETVEKPAEFSVWFAPGNSDWRDQSNLWKLLGTFNNGPEAAKFAEEMAMPL